MVNDEIITELEVLADHFDVQVLITEDLETIDMGVAPWLNNIIVDERGYFAVPHTLTDWLNSPTL